MTNRYTLLHDIASYERDFKKKEGEKEREPRREKRKGREKENRSSQKGERVEECKEVFG